MLVLNGISTKEMFSKINFLENHFLCLMNKLTIKAPNLVFLFL